MTRSNNIRNASPKAQNDGPLRPNWTLLLPREDDPGPGWANYPGPRLTVTRGLPPGPGATHQPPHLMPDETGHDHLRLWTDMIFTAPSHQPPDGVTARGEDVIMARVPGRRNYQGRLLSDMRVDFCNPEGHPGTGKLR